MPVASHMDPAKNKQDFDWLQDDERLRDILKEIRTDYLLVTTYSLVINHAIFGPHTRTSFAFCILASMLLLLQCSHVTRNNFRGMLGYDLGHTTVRWSVKAWGVIGPIRDFGLRGLPARTL